MAGSSLLLLIDDITAVLDDVAAMTKVATQKTAGVLGDDLALNAQQVTGVDPKREIPVIWAVAKGSAVNKLILIPLALSISYFMPAAITPLLAVGGLFLCFEGFEKIIHKLLHPKNETEKQHTRHLAALANPTVDLVALEKDKIKGAIRTDFILSAEIIVISLFAVAGKPFIVQLGTLAALSVLMTVFIYGLVALIVKIDDLGLYLSKPDSDGKNSRIKLFFSRILLKTSPILMRLLSFFGTAAMFLVGGGIIAHAIPLLEHYAHDFTAYLSTFEGALGSVVQFTGPALLNGLIGLLSGGITVAILESIKRVIRTKKNRALPAS